MWQLVKLVVLVNIETVKAVYLKIFNRLLGFSQNKGLYVRIFKIASLAYWVTKYLDGAQFGQNKVNVVFSIGFRR